MNHEHENRAARLILAGLDNNRARFDAVLDEAGLELGTPAAELLGVLAGWLSFSLVTQTGEDLARKILVNTIADIHTAQENRR